jgi:hypothetical protein
MRPNYLAGWLAPASVRPRFYRRSPLFGRPRTPSELSAGVQRSSALKARAATISAGAPDTTPSTSQPNPDVRIASLGRRLGLSSFPSMWRGRMASVWAGHGNLSSAPWKIVGSFYRMIADLGSPRGRAGPRTLPLSGHKICPLRALSNLHPDVPALLQSIPGPTTFTYFPCLFLRLAKPPLFRVIKNFCSCLILVRSVVMWGPSNFILSHGEPKGTDVTLQFPSSFLYNSKFPASRLDVVPPAFMLVFYSAYSTLKMEAICYSGTSIDFQRTTRRYIPEDSILSNSIRLKYDNEILKRLKWIVLRLI